MDADKIRHDAYHEGFDDGYMIGAEVTTNPCPILKEDILKMCREAVDNGNDRDDVLLTLSAVEDTLKRDAGGLF